ncbi:hypothetical protein K7432_016938 [Basidiobolus ranarum]|uniref:Conserved oligomeric Golgi complex subunit 7 n=1 Tax=Basidiobolus ranarum TaxID=34480 RepID=A0ABR2WE16_9FUNG
MEASKNVLREAETWNNLGAEVSSLMAKKAYLDVTTRLEEAQKSLAMFQNSPEYEGRLTLLDNLRNQLEHALIPLLNTAVNGRDVENCKSLYNIFNRIHKEDVFMEMYFCSRQTSLITLWEGSFSEKTDGSNVRDGGQPGKISTSNFSDFLQKFYEEAFIMINQEKTWCVEIFPNPGSVIYSLIRKVFNSLTPSLSSQIDLLAEQQPIVESLPELIRAFKASEKFGSTVENLLYQLYEKNQTDKVIDFNHWGDPIFEGFLSHQCKYPEYESAYLDATLEKILKVDSTKETGDKIVRYMLDVIPKTFNVIDAALSRCLYFTHGFASVGMAKSVSQYICKLIGELETHCDQLSSMFSDGNAVMLSQISEEEEAEVDEYQQVNWQLFQLGLELLSACKRISIQIEEYEKSAKTAILYTDNFLSKELEFGKVSVDITMYDEDSPTSFSIPAQDITVASLSLLKESTLNSLELRSLLIKLQNGAFTLAENPRLASKSFTRQCQKYLFNMLFATIKKQLIDFDKNPAWISNEAGTTSPLKLQIPKFSLSPSTYITRVGEYLLTLPQQLETYTGHESFGFSLDTLPYSQFLINEELPTSPEPTTTVSSPKPSSESPQSRHRSYSTVGGRPTPPGLNRARSYSTMSSDQSNPSNTTRTRRSSSVSGARPRLTSMNSSDQVFETNRRIEITHRWIASVAQATQAKLCDFILGLEKQSTSPLDTNCWEF